VNSKINYFSWASDIFIRIELLSEVIEVNDFIEITLSAIEFILETFHLYNNYNYSQFV